MRDVELALCDIAALVKDSSSLLGLVGIGANIKLTTLQRECYVASLGFARDEAFDLLQQVWLMFMERRLSTVEAAKLVWGCARPSH